MAHLCVPLQAILLEMCVPVRPTSAIMRRSSRVKKCKFSQCIRAWEIRDPATASQFWSAFKVKTMTAVALCWMLPSKSMVSPRAISGNLKLGGGINRWTKLYKRSVHSAKPTVLWRREAWRWRPKRQNCLHWCQAPVKACCLDGKVWCRGKGIRYIIPWWWWLFSDDEGVELARLVEAVFSCGLIPSDGEENFMLNLYKGKGARSPWPWQLSWSPAYKSQLRLGCGQIAESWVTPLWPQPQYQFL